MSRQYWRGWASTATTATLLTGAETALLYLLSAELGGAPGRAPISWPALWALGLLAFFLPRALSGAPSTLYFGVLAPALVGTVLLVVHSAAYPSQPLFDTGWLSDAIYAVAFRPAEAERSVPLAVAMVLAVWWRQAVRETPGSDAVGAALQLGPVPVLLLALIGAGRWGGSGSEMMLVVAYLAAFFLLTLLAAAYTRWAENPAREGNARALAAWLAAAVLPVVAVTVAAAAVASMLFRSAGSALGFLLDWVLFAVGWVLAAVSTVLATVVWAVLYLIVAVVRSLGIGHPAPPQRRATEDPLRQLEALRQNSPSEPAPFFWALLVLLLLVLIYILARYRPRRETLSGSGLVRESVWERPDLSLLARGLRDRLRSLARGEHDPLRELLADPEWRYSAQVRAAYRDAQRSYSALGAARLACETPAEHAGRVGSGSMVQLVSLYEGARYSGRPARPEAAAEARALLRAVRTELQDAKKPAPKGRPSIALRR